MDSRSKRNNIRIRLRTKFMIGIVLLECMLMCTIILLVENRMRATVLEEFLKRGFSIGRNLAAMNANYVTTYNYVRIKQSVEKVAGQSGLVYVAVQLFNGDLAGYSGPEPMNEIIFDDAVSSWVLAGDGEKVRYRRVAGDKLCDITIPIMVGGERWGNACIGMSMGAINVAILETQITLTVMGSIALLLGCIGSLILARRITLPINALVKNVEAIANRQYEHPIEIRTHDEIGYLGRRFISMQQMIKEYVVELKTSNEKLETEISERQRAEEELAEHRNYLEDLVKERTNKLTLINHRLQHEVLERKRAEGESVRARELAEEASAAKSSFLAGMSHEIRTPMNGVLGMAELLSRMNLNRMQARQVEMIRLSGETLLNIINDILDLAKIEAGRMELENHDFDLFGTVENVARLFAGRAHEKNLELSCIIREDLFPALRGDSVRLRQIITNLVGNALKFTDKGEIGINVSLIEEREKSILVNFEVIDTGIGLSSEAQEHIFESFSQADSSITRKFGGTGLGLSISRQLARKMGGEIGVAGNIGTGSTFWFTAELEKQESVRREKPFDLSGLRILAASSKAQTSILQYYITAWGGKIDPAAGGSELLGMLEHALLSETPYDAVIIGRTLPDMDNLTLAKEIRKMPGGDTLRLVILSAGMVDDDFEKMRHAGRYNHMILPICREDLYLSLTSDMDQWEEEGKAKPDNDDKTYAARVLIAEDNPVNQEVGCAMLRTFGLTVDLVADGKQAVDAWSSLHYDMIFMDCQMPVMDGYEATLAIREREKQESGTPGHAPIPIIAVTAYVMGDIRQQCLDAKMDDYLAKPFNRNQLKELLERWLCCKEPGEADKAPPDTVKKVENRGGPLSGPQALQPAAKHPLPHETTPAHLPETPEKNVPADRAPRISSGEPPQREVSHAGAQAPGPCRQSPEASVLDARTLDEIRKVEKLGSANLLKRIIDIYLDSSRKILATLREAIGLNDAETIRKTAHSFKSSSGNVGALSMVSLCKEMEDMGHAGNTGGAEALFPEIEKEYERVRIALKAELGDAAPFP